MSLLLMMKFKVFSLFLFRKIWIFPNFVLVVSLCDLCMHHIDEVDNSSCFGLHNATVILHSRHSLDRLLFLIHYSCWRLRLVLFFANIIGIHCWTWNDFFYRLFSVIIRSNLCLNNIKLFLQCVGNASLSDGFLFFKFGHLCRLHCKSNAGLKSLSLGSRFTIDKMVHLRWILLVLCHAESE